jgi:CPA2 family monovalent cation:H+ antiporter-2
MEKLFAEILILCFAATVVVTASHRIKLPTIVGFIFTGIAVGPSGFALVSSLPSAYNLTELVGIILMFTIGLEFSVDRLKELRQPLIRLGSLQVLCTVLAVALGGWLLTDLPFAKVMLWGFAICLSSTALVLKLLHDFGDIQTPLGRNSMGILLFQDIAVIPMLILLPLFATAGAASGLEFSSWGQYGAWFLKAALAVGSLALFSRYVLPKLLESVAHTRSQELFFFTIIFVCLGTGALFHWIGLSLSLGAFVAGLIIAESAFGKHTMAIFGSLRDTFLGMFFISVGMLLDMRFVLAHLPTVMLLGLTFFVTKVSVITLICLAQKIPRATAILTGLTLCQVGEFSFLLVSSGLKLGIMDEADSQYFMAASVLSMIATPFIYIYGPRIVHRYFRLQWRGIGLENAAANVIAESTGALASPPPAAEHGADHSAQHAVQHSAAAVSPTIIIGYGIAGRNVAEALAALKIPFHVIEMNYGTVKKLSAHGLPISFGDASSPEVLKHAGIAHARMIVIAASGAETVGQIVHSVRRLNPSIPIIVRAQYVRDLKHLAKDQWLRPVVAEIETASELVAHVLKNYGVSTRTIFEYTAKVRTQLNSVAEAVSGHRYSDLELPSWEVLASLRAATIGPKDFAVGKPLMSLALPQVAGVSVVAVFRRDRGTVIPDGSFELMPADIVHLIGDPGKLDLAQNYLAQGSIG